MSTIRVNGVSLYYEEHGAGEPIVALHGGGSSAAMWVEAAPELGKRGRTILYDRRGSFRSERPEPYATNVHEQADDAAALNDGLVAAPAIVIGRSYGGAIAVDLALRYPKRVRALVPEEVKEILIGKRPCARRRDLRRLSGREREAARHDRAAGLVVGAKDSVLGYRETAEVLAAAVPSARIAWVDGGHAIDLAHPVVLSFVDAVLVLKEEPSLA